MVLFSRFQKILTSKVNWMLYLKTNRKNLFDSNFIFDTRATRCDIMDKIVFLMTEAITNCSIDLNNFSMLQKGRLVD